MPEFVLACFTDKGDHIKPDLARPHAHLADEPPTVSVASSSSFSFWPNSEMVLGPFRITSAATAQMLEELIVLAKNMRAAEQRGEQLNLFEEELAFYDALGVNESAVQAMSNASLLLIARELSDAIRKNVTIDWISKESVRAKLRVMVKRILRSRGYPPDLQEKATLMVLAQAEMIARDWAE